MVSGGGTSPDAPPLDPGLLSHLKNLYSMEFSVEMRKIIDCCVEKENGAINMM